LDEHQTEALERPHDRDGSVGRRRRGKRAIGLPLAALDDAPRGTRGPQDVAGFGVDERTVTDRRDPVGVSSDAFRKRRSRAGGRIGDTFKLTSWTSRR